MESYEQTKLLLFQRKELKSVVINVSDPAGARFTKREIAGELLTYGRDPSADVYPLSNRLTDRGTDADHRDPKGEVAFVQRCGVVSMLKI